MSLDILTSPWYPLTFFQELEIPGPFSKCWYYWKPLENCGILNPTLENLLKWLEHAEVQLLTFLFEYDTVDL